MNLHQRENNPESQQILDSNRARLSRQCQRIYDCLLTGKKLTVRDAMVDLGIGDLRRRVCDLRENNIHVQSRLIDGRHKEYFLSSQDLAEVQ